MKIFKFIVAIILLPLCISLSQAIYEILLLSIKLNHYSLEENLSFPLGFILCTLILSMIPKPMRTYVLAHELTHALWAILMGAKIGKMRVTKKGGHVEVSKTNFWITLAPYFFPLYTFIIISVFFISSLFVNTQSYFNLWLGAIGFTWAFHIIFTIDMLKTQQTDITQHGKIFSYIIIYCMHLIFIGTWIVIIGSPKIKDLYNVIIDNTFAIYNNLYLFIQ